MRLIWLVLLGTGCAYISDQHEDWRLDPDEDGVDISSDCDDSDGSLGLPSEWYLDQDEDGFGSPDDMKRQCKQPAGYVSVSGDCDDTNPAVFPEAEELCDYIDNNCDDRVDEGASRIYAYEDSDGDGYGDPTTETLVCELTGNLVENGEDCDDTNTAWQIAQPIEVFYNGLDDNCDGSDVDGDQDADGFWVRDYASLVLANGGVPMAIDPMWEGDCQDANPSVFPGAWDEPYDGVDTDCAGNDDHDQDGDGYVPDEYLGRETEGLDGSGSLPGGDCNDLADTVNPEGVEDCATEHDDDCDGSLSATDAPSCTLFYRDWDSDGYGGDESRCQCVADFEYQLATSEDCNDFDGSVHPGAPDEPHDGIDSDCARDDDYDTDGDGYVADEHVGFPTGGVSTSGSLPGGDCDDSDPAVHSEMEETCLTEVDDDCDGSTNKEMAEGCTWFHYDGDGDGYGDTLNVACWGEPTGEFSAEFGEDCHDAEASIFPGAIDEPYDGSDTDCGLDDDYDQDGDGFAGIGFGGERTLTGDGTAFVEGTGELEDTDCDDTNPLIHPAADEVCDEFDNDCDGETDEDDAIDAVTLYLDLDGDDYGDVEVTIEACARAGYVSEPGDCDDLDQSIFPGAIEVCDDVDDDCDEDLLGSFSDMDLDGVPDCINPPLMADVASTTMIGAYGARVGDSLHIDSLGRLAIGAPLAIGAKSRVYLVSEMGAGERSLETEPTHFSPMRVVPGAEEEGLYSTGFGQQIASMPAVVCDGSEEGCDSMALLVSAPMDSAVTMIEEPEMGRDITWPSSSGRMEIWMMDSVPPGSSDTGCGSSIATGLFALEEEAEPDHGLVVGCPDGETPSVYVVQHSHWIESAGNLFSSGSEIVDTPVISEGFGETLAVADFNADGVDDVVVGAPSSGLFCGGEEETVVQCGAVHVFHGPHADGTNAGEAEVTITGDEGYDQLGHGLATGDLDGDGVADLLVGTDLGSSIDVAAKRGAVLMYASSALTTESPTSLVEDDAHFTLDGDELDGLFGATLAVVPDVDDDGSPELLVGAPGSSKTAIQAGTVYGFRGPWDSGVYTITEEVRALHGGAVDSLGVSMVVGDVGADGITDILVGAPGASVVYGLSTTEWFLD